MIRSRVFLSFRFLFDRKQSRFKYVLKAAAFTLSLAVPLAITLGLLLPNSQAVDFDPVDDFLLLVLFGPVVETFIMGFIFWLIKPFAKHMGMSCFVSAVIWSVIHGISAPIQGIVNFFNFFVFSLGFQVWKKKSYWSGFYMALMVHILHNAGITSLVLLEHSLF